MKIALRRKMFATQNCCQLCGSTHDLQIDHVFPKSKGGSDHLGNLQVLCASCNVRKNNKILSYTIFRKENHHGK